MSRTFPYVLAGMTALLAMPAAAQDTLPASTNPAERVVYRGDMTVADQQAVQLTCYQWASTQTSWDPEVAYRQLEAEHGAALQQFESTRGAAVGGAARGALAGLAIGAIAGDAGQGAAIGAVAGGVVAGGRGRRGRASASDQFEAAASQFKASFSAWDRHWVACMIGNGYGVGEE
jgi:hypothetical protein